MLGGQEEAMPRGDIKVDIMNVIKHVFLANYLGVPGYSVPIGFVPVQNTVENTTETMLPVGFHLQGGKQFCTKCSFCYLISDRYSLE